MKIGVQVGQVVAGGRDLQRQWRDQLEHFRACRDAGFDFVSWGHHWLIHPFQHFQPIPVLARFAAVHGIAGIHDDHIGKISRGPLT